MFYTCVVVCVDETEGMKKDRRVRPFSMFEPTEVPAASLRKNQSSDDLVRDSQVRTVDLNKNGRLAIFTADRMQCMVPRKSEN